MRIALMVEGETEKVFLPYLRGFLEPRLLGKTRDAARILRDQDLMIAIQACPELKGMVNTILAQCGGEMMP